jgi:transcriptional regulator with XRE-family HTH domain
MRESFGGRLRQQREERGISLGTIADQTKIKLSLLDGLERDNISHWPSGLFRRAYVRAYAHAIGLNPDIVVREFLEVHPEPAEVIETPATSGPRMRGLVGTFGSFALRRRTPPVEPAAPIASRQEPPAAAPPVPAPVEPTRARLEEIREEPPVALNTEPTVPQPAAAMAPEPAEPTVDFLAAAHVCTELARVENSAQLEGPLRDAARILEAKGLIVWVWDSVAAELRPALAHGYSNRVLAQLPGLPRDADNVTAAAFRLRQTCTINGREDSSGALAVPLLTPGGCAGVLAIELPSTAVQAAATRAAATFFAAVLAQLVGGGEDAAAQATASA